MKGITLLPMVAMMTTVLGSSPVNSDGRLLTLISSLERMTDFQADVDLRISMTQMPEDVVYSLKLYSQGSTADSLTPCNYLIDWNFPSHNESRGGWSAYFDGNFYRMSGSRLMEYHMADDITPFVPASVGLTTPGIHRRAQFVELLPAFVADDIRRMLADTTVRLGFTADTLYRGEHVAMLQASTHTYGERTSRTLMTFDCESYRPLYREVENNPGSIAEQTLTATYSKTGSTLPGMLGEELLKELYPDDFENFRQSNFVITQMPGRQLPGYALKNPLGQRITYREGDTPDAVTLLALIDPSSTLTADYVKALRTAAAQAPDEVNIIWALLSTDLDMAEEIAAEATSAETILLNARSLATACGAADLPALLIVGTNGVVAHVVIGYNQDLCSDVIQQTALINDNK